MKFIFEQIRTGGDRNFAYLVGDREAKVGAIVDPSYDPEAVVERAKAQGLEVKYILNTHGHKDHTNGSILVLMWMDATVGVLLLPGPEDAWWYGHVMLAAFFSFVLWGVAPPPRGRQRELAVGLAVVWIWAWTVRMLVSVSST